MPWFKRKRDGHLFKFTHPLAVEDVRKRTDEFEELGDTLGESESKKEPKQEGQPLEEMTVKELKELAKKLDIEGYGSMKRSELIEALKAER